MGTSVPDPELQEEAPASNPDRRAVVAEPDGLEVEISLAGKFD